MVAESAWSLCVNIGEDMTRIEAALSTIGNPGRLAVDANGRFDPATAVAYA